MSFPLLNRAFSPEYTGNGRAEQSRKAASDLLDAAVYFLEMSQVPENTVRIGTKCAAYLSEEMLDVYSIRITRGPVSLATKSAVDVMFDLFHPPLDEPDIALMKDAATALIAEAWAQERFGR